MARRRNLLLLPGVAPTRAPAVPVVPTSPIAAATHPTRGFQIPEPPPRALPRGGFKTALTGVKPLPRGGFPAAIRPRPAVRMVPERYGPFPQQVRMVPATGPAPAAAGPVRPPALGLRVPAGRPAGPTRTATPSPSRAPARGAAPQPAPTGAPTTTAPSGGAQPRGGKPKPKPKPTRGTTRQVQPQPSDVAEVIPPTAPPAAPAVDPNDPYAGLPDWAVADLKAFDAATKAQTGMFNPIYNQLATQAGSDADAATRRLGTLASLAAGSYQPNVPSAGAPGPYGTVAAPTQAAAVANLPGALSDAQRQQLLAQTALAVNTASSLPTLARAAGQTAAQTYQAGRQADRNAYLQNARQTILQQAQHTADMAARESEFRRTLGSTEEGRAIDLALGLYKTAAKGTTGGTVHGLVGPFASADEARAAGLNPVQAGDGQIYGRAPAAADRPQRPTGLVGPIDPGQPLPKGAVPQYSGGQLYYRMPSGKAGGGAAGSKPSDLRQVTKYAQQLHDGLNRRKATQADVDSGIATAVGQTIAEQYDPEEIFPKILAMGISPREAFTITTSVTGKRINARNMWNGLRSNNVPATKAYALVRALTGVDLRTPYANPPAPAGSVRR